MENDQNNFESVNAGQSLSTGEWISTPFPLTGHSLTGLPVNRTHAVSY